MQNETTWLWGTRKVFQKYCGAMQELGLKVMELLGISLEVDRLHFKDFFKDGCSIMRCNYYPPCQQPSLALGTGPHCDPTSLTILHQDQVGGLDVFADNKWQTVPPVPGVLIFNIGDTFSVCTLVLSFMFFYHWWYLQCKHHSLSLSRTDTHTSQNVCFLDNKGLWVE